MTETFKTRPIEYRTVNLKGDEIAVGELKRVRNNLELLHFCMVEFGHCLGAIRPDEDKVWVFARCHKDADKTECAIEITTITGF